MCFDVKPLKHVFVFFKVVSSIMGGYLFLCDQAYAAAVVHAAICVDQRKDSLWQGCEQQFLSLRKADFLQPAQILILFSFDG